jgi:hypothetical protein
MSVLDFLKTVNVDVLSPDEAADYLKLLATWQSKISGVAPAQPHPSTDSLQGRPVHKIDSAPLQRNAPPVPAAPQLAPSVQELAKRALPNGPGNFSMIATRYRRAFGITLSHSKRTKEAYTTACRDFGEDFVLSEFDEWQKVNQWIREKGHSSGLTQLYESLSSAREAGQLVQADESNADQVVSDEESAKQAALQAGRSALVLAAIKRQQDKRAEEAAAKISENPEALFS